MNPRNWNEPLSTKWASVAFVLLSPLVAVGSILWYTLLHGVHAMDVTLFLVFFLLSGLAVTAGYHRYYAHRSYECHPLLQLFHLIFGAISLQFPVIQWARTHRVHHRYSDTELDPHDIGKGFFYAHVGWIFRRTPLDRDFSAVRDLTANRLCQWQRKYYGPIVLVVGVLLPVCLGWLVDRPLAGLLWGGLLRVVVQSHMTYSINSFAHRFGRRPYSIRNQARDSWILALFSYGEGYHNFHHRFAADYRNGHRWYHWDPSKWFIRACASLGLARNLKTSPAVRVLDARIETELEKVRVRLEPAPKEVSRSLEERVKAAADRLRDVARRLSEAKRRYRADRLDRLRSAAERSIWKSKLRQYRRELQAAKLTWKGVLVTASCAAPKN